MILFFKIINKNDSKNRIITIWHGGVRASSACVKTMMAAFATCQRFLFHLAVFLLIYASLDCLTLVNGEKYDHDDEVSNFLFHYFLVLIVFLNS